MIADKNYLKRTTLYGTLLVIPWECFLIFGFALSFRNHEPLWAWIFLFFAFLLNIPAVVLSWVKPRFAAGWILINIAISVAIGIGFEIKNYIAGTDSSITLLAETLNIIAFSVLAFAFLWLVPAAYALGLLTITGATKQQSAQTTTPELNPSR